MTTPIAKFRKSMDNFLTKLNLWAVQDPEQKKQLEKFKMKYEMGMKANPRGSLEFFLDAITPYADHIMKGDDEFFLNEHIEVDDEYNSLSQQLKVWWPELEDKQRNYVKTQFKLLLMLGAIATKNETLRLVINNYRSPDSQLTY